ncbi:MAG: ATP-dependent RecD-like DNA helicase [Actinobacteria bacterium]|nr:ATP-dependent RecD-like DNA helicase [Actinomycetota bacterium]
MNNNDENHNIKIKGVLERIVYKNPENDYFIGKLRTEDGNEIITITGYSIEIQPGEKIEISGKWVFNKKYGKQFEIKNIEFLNPTTVEGIEKYLGSGLIKGIGPAMSRKIVSKFKLETLDILDYNPERLSEIEGFGNRRIGMIKNEWKKQKDVREIMIFMQSYGISNSYAIKIYNIYGSNSVNILRSNPYKLIEDVVGIGFRTADKISEKLGIEKDSIFRIKSGIVYLMNEATDSGHCYYPFDEFIEIAQNLLEVERSQIYESIKILEEEGKIIIIEEGIKKIYLKNIFDDEKYVCEKLLELNNCHNNKFSHENTDLVININKISGENNVLLDEIQIEAITKSLNEKILIITGSPGTGKSTILNFIIKLFEQNKKKVLIAAPTGRAAKRLTEATSKEAKTIHRLLKYQPKINKFLKNEDDNLDADLVIIDEASMLDIRLVKSLLKAIGRDTYLIFVGDIDQLPAVGPGNVLADIINSGIFPVVELKKIYRQEGNSQIILNAHKIRDGIYPNISRSNYNDFFFIDKIDPEQVVELILNLITQKIPGSFGYDPFNDIQVLVPTHKGIVGVSNLNQKIQERLNKNKPMLTRGNTVYKVNDKVIQLKNNYEKDVYNGDIGFIKSIDLEMKELTVNYDGRNIDYDFYDLDEISLSYAISIHKSQGSEFKCVIIPILTSHYMLLQRNLLYTAITRAREVAVIIGSKKAIGIAVNKNPVERRYTALKDILKDSL